MQSLHDSNDELPRKDEPDQHQIQPVQDDEDVPLPNEVLAMPLADLLGKPSALLANRCPVCFGGMKPVFKHSQYVFLKTL